MAIELYMRDCYKKEWDTKVKSVKDGKFVVLEESYFYPASGGQPWDEGTLKTTDGREVNVVYAGKFGGVISHQVEPENVLKEGDDVHCKLDWERRYKHMRMHTAAHIISHIFQDKKGALITGNQLGTDKSRIDYQLEDYNPEEMKSYEPLVNEVVKKALPVHAEFLNREEAEEKVAKLSNLKVGFPEDIKEVRLLTIEGFDVQACGGTHLKNTSEVGTVKFIKFDNKGKNNRRVYYELAD